MSNPRCQFHDAPTFRACWYKGVAQDYEIFVCSDERHDANTTGDKHFYTTGNDEHHHRNLVDRLLGKYSGFKGYRIVGGDWNSN